MFWLFVILISLLFSPVLLPLVIILSFRGIGWKDYKFFLVGLRIRFRHATFLRARMNVPRLFAEQLARRGDSAPAIFYESDRVSFGDLERLSNRVANFAALSQIDIKAGEVVAIMLDNCPEFVSLWLGFAKLGACIALVNTGLKLGSLEHAIASVGAKLLVFGRQNRNAVKDISAYLKASGILTAEFTAGEKSLFGGGIDDRYAVAAEATIDAGVNLNLILHALPTSPIPAHLTAYERGIKFTDPLFYIYTSGTTGLPKAAKMTHARFDRGSTLGEFFDITHRDRIYVSMPLFHGSAGVIGTGLMLTKGCSIALRTKFSAREFWSDIRRYECTVFQYIGELCRFVLSTPPQPSDGRDHRIRLALGNGMKSDIWQAFQERFKVPLIGEFYSASEAPAAILNLTGEVNACGFISPLVKRMFPIEIVQYDTEKEEIVRSKDGFAIRCKPGQVGQLIAKVESVGGASNYQGYNDPKASLAKLETNVFQQNDVWFKSGDLLKTDERGFVYFVDRIGDTFRWRGHNVATTEVENVMAAYAAVSNDIRFRQCNVYGIQLPGFDGRIGACALMGFHSTSSEAEVLESSIEFPALVNHLQRNLPTYALPFFLRFAPDLGMNDSDVLATQSSAFAASDSSSADSDSLTATMKFKKTRLRSEGIDTDTDPIYFLDLSLGTYVRLTDTLKQQILKNEKKLA